MARNDLIFNPYAELLPLEHNGTLVAIQISAPIKGQSLMVTGVPQGDPVFPVLLSLLRTTTAVEVDADYAAVFRKIGLLIPRSQISEEVRYSCTIDNDTLSAVPARNRLHRVPAPGESFAINSSLRLERAPAFGNLVPGADLSKHFKPAAAVAWITDQLTAAAWPYWIDEPLFALLTKRAPLVVTDEFAADVWESLVLAGILVQDSPPVADIALCRHQFREDKYVVMKSVLPALHCGALRRYSRSVIAEGLIPFTEDKLSARFAKHNDPVMCFILRQLLVPASNLASTALKPTYSFLGSYRNGSALRAHLDREQCEYSGSLLIDFSPEPDNTSDWPLFFQSSRRKRGAANLGIGDIVFYRGRELVHFRDKLNGELSTSVFLHYVEESFSGSLQ